MTQRILLISRDPDLQLTRSLLLESAGYATLLVRRFSDALAAATEADLAIIGQTFTWDEQDDFVERARERNPALYVLCLRDGLVNPEVLLGVCHECLAAEPGAARTRALDDSDVVIWPKKGPPFTARQPDYRFRARLARPA